MKTCKFCCSEVPKTAVICTNCGQYQNWRKYVNLSSVFLSLAIALFTVVSFTLPVLRAQFEAPKTELTATLLGINDGMFHFLIANSGNRIGTVSGFRLLELNTAEAQNGLGSKQRGLKYNTYDLIKPGEAVKVIAVDSEETPVLLNSIELGDTQKRYIADCAVGFNVVNFDGQIDNITIEFKCIPSDIKDEWQNVMLVDAVNQQLKIFSNLPFIGGALSGSQIQGLIGDALNEAMQNNNTNASNEPQTEQEN
jgi:hypothetical protein